MTPKAIVHVSGTLLRKAWWAKDRNNCIVVRPAAARDTVAYVVNQVRFDGPTEMIYGTQPRKEERHERDNCAPSDVHLGVAPQGVVGSLPGFDNSILVYLEAEEGVVHIQPNEGDEYIPLQEFQKRVQSKLLDVPILNPMIELGC